MIDRFKFFEKDKLCPICQNKLSLYLSINGAGTFKYHQPINSGKGKKKFAFYPLKDTFFQLNRAIGQTDYIQLNMINDIDFSLSLSSESLFRTIETSSMYFFYLCNSEGFIQNFSSTINSYTISLANACYYKSTNHLSFKKKNNSYVLSLDNDSTIYMEVFYLIKKENEFIKSYCLSYDFNQKKSNFFFIKEDTSFQTDFLDKKDIYNKELDLLEYYPNFTDKSKIIEKFESWIMFS